MVRQWFPMEETNNSEVYKHKNCNKTWSSEKKLELVSQILAGKVNQVVAIEASISDEMLYQWVRKYKIYSYNRFIDKQKSHKSKNLDMKKININNPRKLKESEYDELIRLRAENEYIKAENEIIKKKSALREEKQAALLKAKK